MPDASSTVTSLDAVMGETAIAVPLPANEEAAPIATPTADAGDVSLPDKGDRDPCGDIVGKVYARNSRFMIYATGNEGEFGRLRYLIFGTYEQSVELQTNIGPTMVAIAQITDILCGVRGSPKTLFPFIRLASVSSSEKEFDFLAERCRAFMARAMQMALEGKPELAKTMLATLREELAARRDSRNRMRYIFANAAALTMIIVAWIGMSWLGEDSTASTIKLLLFGQFESAVQLRYLDVLMFGALGAFFSVSIGLKDVRVNHSLTLAEMIYAGIIRVPIGILAASVVILTVEGGWFPTAADQAINPWLFCLLGFIAGFSELFVPNMLKQMETRAHPKPSDPTATESPAR